MQKSLECKPYRTHNKRSERLGENYDSNKEVRKRYRLGDRICILAFPFIRPTSIMTQNNANSSDGGGKQTASRNFFMSN